jgi:hypothetical protein
LTKHFYRSCRLTFPREIEWGLSCLESNKQANLPDSIGFSLEADTIKFDAAKAAETLGYASIE